MPVFEKRVRLPASAVDVFRWHAAPGAFARLTPPFDAVRVLRPLTALVEDAVAELEVSIGPASVRWLARHTEVRDGSDGGVAGFVDTMERGPFSTWRHEHRFEPVDDHSCDLVDRITWASLPGAGFVVPARLNRLFAYRHAVTHDDLVLARDLGRPARRVVGITGASGLIGRELTGLLQALGHDVRAFVRVSAVSPLPAGQIAWNPATGAVDAAACAGLDAVVHLAGENIADGRMNDAKRARLHTQRVDQTRLLLRSLAALPVPPSVVVGANAVGYFGNRGDEALYDDSAPGDGPLADFCVDWQQAVLEPPTSSTHWRAVAARIGIVQSASGGALGKVLPLFQAGLGGPLGDGKSWTPAIGLDDMADVLARCLFDDRVVGAVNAVGPEPVRNSEYTRILGDVLHRPAILPVPRFGLKAVLGDFGDNVLDSARAYPRRLLQLGHRFRHNTVEHALRHLLGHVER